MNKNINIETENLKDIAPILSSIPKENAFSVPMNYFDNLESVIAKKALAASLEAIPKENPFAVPANYFDELAIIIYKKIAATELVNIPKENPFEVPAGYFESLDSEIIDHVLDSQKKKGFEWIGLLVKPKFAVSFATLALGVFFVFKISTVNKLDKYSFTEQEIANSNEINDIDEGTIIETLYSDNNKTSAQPKQKDIENYLLDNDVDESQITGQL